MKKYIFSLLTAGACLGFTACNNSGDTSANGDSSAANMGDSNSSAMSNGTSATDNNMSSNDYSAFADSTERNSQAGYYLNAKTGKPLKLKVNRTNGSVTDEATGEPVWRYVDNRSWWVYGLNERDSDLYWGQVGQARQDKNNELSYKGENDAWVNYDKEYGSTDTKMNKTWKTRIGDTKIKFDKDGDIKVKDKTGTTKYDADDNKVKTDSSHK